MGEETSRDLKALTNGRSFPPWAWALMGALGIGGPGSLAAYFRGAPDATADDPRIVAAEAKVEELKAAEIQEIKTRVVSVEKGQKRLERLMGRVAEKLRVRDDEGEDER